MSSLFILIVFLLGLNGVAVLPDSFFISTGKGYAKIKAVYPQEAPSGCSCCRRISRDCIGDRWYQNVHSRAGAGEPNTDHLCWSSGWWSGPRVYVFASSGGMRDGNKKWNNSHWTHRPMNMWILYLYYIVFPPLPAASMSKSNMAG